MRSDVEAEGLRAEAGAVAAEEQFLTLFIDQQMFGLRLSSVQEVLDGQIPTPIRLATPEVAGVINLRGRIITAIDVRRRLGLPDPAGQTGRIGVVVHHDGETYDLIFDAVGEVLPVGSDIHHENPPTLDPRWRACCAGVYRLKSHLMVVLNLDAVLDLH